MLMTNGIGAAIGTLGAQAVVNSLVNSQTDPIAKMEGWSHTWFIFAAYALVITIAFAILFKYKHVPEK
jgi:NHS family nucleoside permease-like MFS transporter/NHS family xanthosine MFS transporter